MKNERPEGNIQTARFSSSGSVQTHIKRDVFSRVIAMILAYKTIPMSGTYSSQRIYETTIYKKYNSKMQNYYCI